MSEKEYYKILCVETSGICCGVALGINGELLNHHELHVPNIHDSKLAEITSRVLRESNTDIKDIDAVAVSAGPGSFTGLRIGVSFCKALCFGNNPKLILCSTLRAFAFSAHQTANHRAENIISIIPAQRGLYYVQRFSTDASPASTVTLVHQEDVSSIIEQNSLIVGNGAKEFQTGFKEEDYCDLSPRHLLGYSFSMFCEDALTDVADATPYYFQDFIPKSPQSTEGIQ